MTITKQEVRTHYTIQLTAIDLGNAIDYFKNNEVEQITNKNAFNYMDTNDMTLENLLQGLKKLGFRGNDDTYKVIAKCFGFDGWEHAGYYKENCKRYIMLVYNDGNTL